MKNLGIREDDTLNGTKSWCWDKSIWTFSGDTPPQFDFWIRHLTSAIIICCFNVEEEKRFEGEFTKDLEKFFFWHCQRIAYLDHTFASTMFPLLILTLSTHEKYSYTSSGKNCSTLNSMIAKAFECVLLSWIHPIKSFCPYAKNDLKYKSVSLVIDTLDILRRVSQCEFLSSKHRPNKKTKKGGLNRKLEPLIPWQGIGYGTILNMDGIIVAEACMKVERFASALFFLEMYFNSQYGKSGGLFEELEKAVSCVDVIGAFNGTQDISGMGPSSIQDSDDDDLKARTIKAMSITSRCYKELAEIELMHATNMQLSSLDFLDSKDLAIDLEKFRGISALDTLQVLGCRSSQFIEPDSRLFLSMISSN